MFRIDSRTLAVCMLVMIANWSVTAASRAGSPNTDRASRQTDFGSLNSSNRASLPNNRVKAGQRAVWATATGQPCSLSLAQPFLSLLGASATTTAAPATTTCPPVTSTCTLPAATLTACDAGTFTTSAPIGGADPAAQNVFVSAAPTGTIKGGVNPAASCLLYLTPPAPFSKIRLTCTNAAAAGNVVGVTVTGANINGATIVAADTPIVNPLATQGITSWPGGPLLVKFSPGTTAATDFIGTSSCSWTSIA